MTNNKAQNSLLEPLKVALKLEREGRRFFLEAAKIRPAGWHGKRFVLAHEEGKHIDNIQSFYDSVKSSGGANLPEQSDSDAESRLIKFTDRLTALKDEYQSTDSDAEAYRMAMAFENGAEEFYLEKMNEAQNPQVRRFYEWLIAEEAMHGRLLKSCLRFVEDPTAWFDSHKGN